ncbi:hypothetical protein DFH94DRAFT_634277 [Russula ochroleuca]|uniref:Uncharacterized protein n=1 Tax=Russula ochroleuca TaxID=152965 RepID=A0A9P5T7E3_9AGAM|nr:hypothetical protein DFH94DRAFT_634277 [Russula ochroleuca]
MLGCLDDIPLEQIRRFVIIPILFWGLGPFFRFANRSVHFILAYCQGLSGAQVAWANRKYHRYHILPPDMVVLVKETVSK